MASGTNLVTILEAVGPPTLSAWVVPHQRPAVPVTDVVIYDRQEDGQIDEGVVLLAVGLDAGETAGLVADAADAGAAAVVVRTTAPGARQQLVDAARRHGLALLAMAPGVTWARMGSLLRNALSTTGTHMDGAVSEPSHHDLTSVANTLASAVNGSVAIFSPQQEILAASRLHADDDPMRHRAVLAQHGPTEYRERLRQMGVYEKLWGTDEVVSIPAVPDLDAGRRQAIVIRAGEEILGSIWIAEGSVPLASDAAATLRSAAVAASGHLVWLQARAHSQRRFTEGLLLQLLSGDADVYAVANWLGVEADQPCAVVSAYTPDSSDRRRLSNLLGMHFSAYRNTVLTLVSHGTIDLALCDLHGDVNADNVADLVGRVAGALDRPVLAAVGTTQSSLQDLPLSHQHADAVLRVLRSQSPAGVTRVACYDDVRSTIQADQLRHHVAQRPDLGAGFARTLTEWDRRHHTRLADSVLAYLEAFGNVGDAARRVHVHPNTLRYRLRRACEVSGMDLTDPDQRLVTQLQLGALTLSAPT